MKKSIMKNLLLSLGILTIVVPSAMTLISCAGDNNETPGGDNGGNPGGGGGDINPPPVDPPVDNREYVNWTEDVTITSELVGSSSGGQDYINYPEGGIKAETHKIGNWVEGIHGRVWEPIMYNFHFKLDSYQMKSRDKDAPTSTIAEAETLYNEPFTADIPAYFDENGVFLFKPTQIPEHPSITSYLKWTGKTSNSNILYTTDGGSLWFLNTNGQGMSFKNNQYGNVQGLTLVVNDTYSTLISGSGGSAKVTDDQSSKYTNVPLMKENSTYSVYNSKYSFTVSQPSIKQDK